MNAPVLELETSNWKRIMKIAINYPSPHNCQPMRVEVVDELCARIYFDTSRGLFASEFGYSFSYLSVGVFIEYVTLSAKSLGYELKYSPSIEEIDLKRDHYLHYFGTLQITKSGLEEKPKLQKDLLQRQTSREAYSNQKISSSLLNKIAHLAHVQGVRLNYSDESELVRRVMLLNQEAVFHDLGEKKMHDELAHWLRYNDRQARKTRDGLSAKCLVLPGFLLSVAVKQPFLVNNSITSKLFKNFYLKTMKNVPAIVWLSGRFNSHDEHIQAGRLFMRIWMELSSEGYYLHPYGSVTSNPIMLRRFLKIVEAPRQSETTWMIFRVGKSVKPPESYRLKLEEHFVDLGG